MPLALHSSLHQGSDRHRVVMPISHTCSELHDGAWVLRGLGNAQKSVVMYTAGIVDTCSGARPMPAPRWHQWVC